MTRGLFYPPVPIKIVLACLCVVIALHARSASAQTYHYGINAHDVSGIAADKTTELGADVIRVVFGWDIIEPNCKGCFNWTITDAWVVEARRTKRTIFATLGYSPRWANGGGPYSNPPLDYRDWYDFVFAVVDRYKDDIVLWGVWNEPNLGIYLRNADLSVYEQLVRHAQAAIRTASPSALVLGPEVSHHAIANGWYAAAMKSFGDAFDIVTVHWYADASPIEAFMDSGVRPYARGKSIWLTESGMSPCDSTFSEAGQALFFQRVLQAFDARRAWWTAVLFYVLYDPPRPLECGSGITRVDWSNRPAFSLYQAFIRTHP